MVGIAAYARVSTEDQKLRRQVLSVLEYSEDQLGAETGDREHNVVADYVADEDTPDTPVESGDVTIYYDRATGTDTARDGYQQVLDAASDVDAVVSHSVSRVSRSIRDLDATVDDIVEDAGAELHIISEGFQLKPEEDDPFQNAMLRLLGVFAELEADLAQQRAKEGIQARMGNQEEYHHGPAPLGYEKENGRLARAANYDHVEQVLRMVHHGEMSKRKAAKELGTSRATVNRSLEDRPELYNLPELTESIYECSECGHFAEEPRAECPVCRRDSRFVRRDADEVREQVVGEKE